MGHDSKKLTFAFSSARFSVRFVAKRYILQQKRLKGQIGTCLLGTHCTTFSPVHRPWQCTALQKKTDDRRTTDDADSRSYCVAAVRSAKYLKNLTRGLEPVIFTVISNTFHATKHSPDMRKQQYLSFEYLYACRISMFIRMARREVKVAGCCVEEASTG